MGPPDFKSSALTTPPRGLHGNGIDMEIALICMEGSDSLQIYTVTVFLFCRKIILSAELNDRQFTLQGCFLKNGQPSSRSQRDLILDIILYYQYCLMWID